MEPLESLSRFLWKYYGYSLPDPPTLMAQRIINGLTEDGFSIAPTNPEKGGLEAITEDPGVDTTLDLDNPSEPVFSEFFQE